MAITITGDGGHGSNSLDLKLSVKKGLKFYLALEEYMDKLRAEGKKFLCIFPLFHSGERYNVVGEKTVIEGQLKTFDPKIRELIMNKIQELLQEIEK